MAQVGDPLKHYERDILRRRFGQKVAMLENLEQINLDGARPLFKEMQEDAMASLMDATSVESMLRYQGEARAYALLASTVDTLRAEVEELRKQLTSDAGTSGEGNAAP